MYIYIYYIYYIYFRNSHDHIHPRVGSVNLGFPELNSGYSLREVTTRDMFP